MDVAAQLALLLSQMETRGWQLELRPHDILNPGFGWFVRVVNDRGVEISYREASTPHGALNLLLASID